MANVKNRDESTPATRFVAQQLRNYPGSDPEVLLTIADLRYSQGTDGCRTVTATFLGKHSLHFAVMLKGLFKRGIVCSTDWRHYVWLDGTDPSEDTAYDVTGVRTDYDNLTPVKNI